MKKDEGKKECYGKLNCNRNCEEYIDCLNEFMRYWRGD